MLSRAIRPLLLGVAIALLSATSAQAASLAQVKYRLHLDNQAEVEDDQRILAARGDNASRLLLAEVLAGSPERSQMDEAVELYKSAFANGRGELPALSALSALAARNPQRHQALHGYVTESLERYPHTRDFLTLGTTLDVFLAYPENFTPERVGELLELYNRACVERCRGLLYEGALAEYLGQRERAEELYRQAMNSEAQAVERFYRILGEEQQDEKFSAHAKSLMEQMDDLPLDVVQSIGNHLTSIAREHDPDVVVWLDNAITRGAVTSMVSKASYMMGMADQYGPDEVFALIDRIGETRPRHAKALRASAYIVRSWITLDPFKAKELIDELLAEGYENAYLNLGELYSMGGLDEVDQLKALEAYHHLATQGLPSAFYRIANVYASGRGMCNDKVKAYAYAKIAVDLGELGARRLLQDLAKEIGPEAVSHALQASNNILKETKAQL
jgi:alginate biosynthesis protein AlgK